MKTVSNDFKNELKKDSYIYREYITVDGLTFEVKASLFDDCFEDGNFIGTFIMKRIEIDIDEEHDFLEKEIVFYKSLNINGTWEDIKIGTFVVVDSSVNDTKSITSISGLDYGLKFANYYSSILDYESGTVTLQDVLNEITDNLGFDRITLDINGDFVVTDDQFTGTGSMFGDVVKAIAQITGNFAIINENDQLEFVFTKTTDIVIEDYVELEDKRDTHYWTSVSLGSSFADGNNITAQDPDLVALYGENWLNINDNPFAYDSTKKAALINPILEKVKGFGYSSFVTDYSFMPQAELGDLVQIKNSEGDIVNSIVLRLSSDYDEITLEAPSITKATVTYKTPVSALIIAKRAEIIVNRAEAKISAVTEKTEQIDLEINNIYQDLNTKLESYATDDSLFEVANRVEQLQTSQDITFSIVEDIKDNGVSIVRTETNVVVDKNGVSVDTSDAPTSSNLNSNGIIIYDKTSGSNTELLFAGYDATIGQSQVRTANLSVSRYFEMGNNTRFEDYQREGENPGTGVFYKGKK